MEFSPNLLERLRRALLPDAAPDGPAPAATPDAVNGAMMVLAHNIVDATGARGSEATGVGFQGLRALLDDYRVRNYPIDRTSPAFVAGALSAFTEVLGTANARKPPEGFEKALLEEKFKDLISALFKNERMTPTALAQTLNQSKEHVSRKLAELYKTGVVRKEPLGKNVYYVLSPLAQERAAAANARTALSETVAEPGAEVMVTTTKTSITTSFSPDTVDELSPQPVIRFLNSVYDLENNLWGDPVSALLIRTIALGQMENQPYDASSLSAALHLPKPAVFRRLARLIQAGLIKRRKLGRANYLVPTAEVELITRERTGEILKLLCKLVIQLQRDCGALGKSAPQSHDQQADSIWSI